MASERLVRYLIERSRRARGFIGSRALSLQCEQVHTLVVEEHTMVASTITVRGGRDGYESNSLKR